MSKKLILTSTGFVNSKIRKRFLDLVGKKPSEIKVLFIPTASRTDKEIFYVRKSEAELIEMGLQKNNIFWLDTKNISAAGNLDNYHVIYICGGNTFYLLRELRNSGINKKIIELVNNGKVYVGVSAGSIIAGPDISVAETGDENDIGLKDMKGMYLTDKVINPHYKDEYKEVMDGYRKKFPFKIINITDVQVFEEIDGIGKITE